MLRRLTSNVPEIVLLAAIYVATARLGLHLAPAGGFATLVWPPSGISLAALLLYGYRLWPGVAIGAFVANGWIGGPIPVAIGIACGNVLEAVLGTYVLREVQFHVELDRARDVVALIGFGGLISTTVSATIGIASLFLGGSLHADRCWEAWLSWWSGDLVGDVLVAPLILAWVRREALTKDWSSRSVLEPIALLFALVGMLILVFEGRAFWPHPHARPYMLFPLLLWAALRFGPLGAATANFVIAVAALTKTALGTGPFIHGTINDSLLMVQSFLGFSGITTLVVGAVVAERAQHLMAVKRAEELKSATLEGALDAIVTIDQDGKICEFNPSAEKLFGVHRAMVIGRSAADFGVPLRPPGSREDECIGRRMRLSIRRFDGSEFLAEIAVSRLAMNGPPRYTAFIRDITRVTEAEQALREASYRLGSLREKDVLLREVHHRVKNNLQVIASLLNLQASTVDSDEARRGLEESETRVQSMALVHELLYQSEDLRSIEPAEYFEKLVARVARINGKAPEMIRVSTSHPCPSLDIDTAIPCGLIINELISNSLKHGFPKGRQGHVDVRMACETGDRFTFQVTDDGVGMGSELDWDGIHTLGLQIVRALVKQLRGAISMKSDGSGTEVQITFPLHRESDLRAVA